MFKRFKVVRFLFVFKNDHFFISLNDPFCSSIDRFFAERHPFPCTKNFVRTKTMLTSILMFFCQLAAMAHEQPHESHIRIVSFIQFWYNCKKFNWISIICNIHRIWGAVQYSSWTAVYSCVRGTVFNCIRRRVQNRDSAAVFSCSREQMLCSLWWAVRYSDWTAV